MALPTQAEVKPVLLDVLAALGGRARPREVYPYVTDRFPQITPEDVSALVGRGRTPQWQNRVQWARQNLVEEGLIDASERGIWQLTPAGEDAARRAAEGSDDAGGAAGDRAGDGVDAGAGVGAGVVDGDGDGDAFVHDGGHVGDITHVHDGVEPGVGGVEHGVGAVAHADDLAGDLAVAAADTDFPVVPAQASTRPRRRRPGRRP